MSGNKKIVVLNYVFMLCTIFLGISGIIGTILAYVKKKEYENLEYLPQSEKYIYLHFKSIFKTSLLYIFLVILSWILIFTIIGSLIGYPLLLLSTIYFYYSQIVGLIKFNKNMEP